MFTVQIILWRFWKVESWTTHCKESVRGVLLECGYPLCHSQDEELPPNVFLACYTLWALLTSFYKCASNLPLAGLCEELGLRHECAQLGRAREGEETKGSQLRLTLCHRCHTNCSAVGTQFRGYGLTHALGLCSKCMRTELGSLLWNSRLGNLKPSVN